MTIDLYSWVMFYLEYMDKKTIDTGMFSFHKLNKSAFGETNE